MSDQGPAVRHKWDEHKAYIEALSGFLYDIFVSPDLSRLFGRYPDLSRSRVLLSVLRSTGSRAKVHTYYTFGLGGWSRTSAVDYTSFGLTGKR